MKTTNYFKLLGTCLALSGAISLPAQSPCTPTITSANGSGGSVNFTVTPSTTVAPTMYIWGFSPGIGYVASTLTTHSYTFPTNGLFQVSVTYSLNGPSPCSGIDTQTILITNAGCNLNANFTAVSSFSAGTTTFWNTTTNYNLATTYLWSYGDGTTGTSSSGQHTHTYPASGTYVATLTANNNTSPSCTATKTLLVNVPYGPPCTANANFTLTPTGTPQVWNATPAFPSNVTSATWSWGDGSSSNTLYTSHTYSAAGTYSICLEVIVDCGDTATSCFSYAIFKSANPSQDMNVIRVDVVSPVTVGLSELSSAGMEPEIYPNPNNGSFQLNLKGLGNGSVNVSVYDLVGRLVYQTEGDSSNGSYTKNILLNHAQEGAYFIKASAGGRIFTKKVIIAGH